MMRGYWRDPELTATVIDAEGWLHTGDLGRLDADGNLTIAGRRKEMYIRGGYNVYPTEVEAALHGPSVDHARPRSSACPTRCSARSASPSWCSPPTRRSPATTSTAILDDVRTWCRARIADYKAPDRVVVVDELPLTAVGKLDKPALAAAVDRRAPGAASGGQR